MKKIILMIMISISSLSCYDGLNDMLGNLDMNVPICVNSVNGSDLDNGRGWTNAKATIQAAINATDSGDEIWVAGDWSIGTTITVNESVSIYGGFNGTESRIEQRTGKSSITGNASTFNVSAQGVVIDGFNFNSINTGNCILLTDTGSYSIRIINCEFNNTSGITNHVPLMINGTTYHHAVEIINSEFDSNKAGAVDAVNTALIIRSTSFTNNSITPSGGAINCTDSTLSISGGDFTDNTAQASGGAIFSSNSTVTITDCDFIHNTAQGSGGAIIFSGSGVLLSINGGAFTQNQASNTGATGGAIRAESSCSVKLAGVTFTKNSASTDGGAIYADSASFDISGCNFGIKGSDADANTASGQGGALYLSGSTAILNNTNCYNNTAATGGGAIFITNSSNVTINGSAAKKCEIYGNRVTTSNNHGGGIFNKNSICTITYCSINNNRTNILTDYGSGGGIYSNSTCTISNSEICHNEARTCGGIHILNGDTDISDCEISYNIAYYDFSGGGLFIDFADASTPSLRLANSRIIKNQAGVNGGTALYRSGTVASTCYIINTLFEDLSDETYNLIYMDGGGSGSYYNFYNCTLISNFNLGNFTYTNFYNSVVYGVSISTQSDATFNYTGSNFTTNAEINLDAYRKRIYPHDFTNLTTGNYSPSQYSILINAGDNDDIPSGITTDLAGNPRIVNNIVDIGCYERQ